MKPDKSAKSERLSREAENLRSRDTGVLSQSHDSARLAYLLELVFEDQELYSVHGRLKKLSASQAVIDEDIPALALLVEVEAKEIGMHPFLLALCLVQWSNQSDLSESVIEGSEDWFSKFPDLLPARDELGANLRSLTDDLADIFKGAGLEPEFALTTASKKCGQLKGEIEQLLKVILGRRGRRKRLFYEMTKTHLEAYYLKKIRKTDASDRAFLNLFARQGEVFDPALVEDQKRLKKRILDSAGEVEKLVEAELEGWGVQARAKRKKAAGATQ